MRRLLWLLTLGALAVALTACPRKAEEEAATETAPAEETSLPGANVRVGLAFDAGGKFDRSFNQSAWEGAQRAAQELGVQIFDFEPADPSQVGQGIRTFAEEGFDLVIGVGFANEPAITATAKEFPNVKFAVIDAVPGEGQLPNALGVVFREHEGASSWATWRASSPAPAWWGSSAAWTSPSSTSLRRASAPGRSTPSRRTGSRVGSWWATWATPRRLERPRQGQGDRLQPGPSGGGHHLRRRRGLRPRPH